MFKNVIAVLLVACFALAGCGPKEAEKEKFDSKGGDSTKKMVVDVKPVEMKDIPNEVKTVGTLEASEDVLVSVEVSGNVREILYKEGGFVEKDAPLAKIEDAAYILDVQRGQASHDKNKAELESSLKNFERKSPLFEKKLISEQDYIDAKARFDKAQADANRSAADLAFVQLNLDKTLIKAPIAGYCANKLVSAGEYIKAGNPLVRIVDRSKTKVTFSIPESEAPKVKPGQQVRIEVPVLGSKAFDNAENKIYYISPRANAATRSFDCKAIIINATDELKPGYFVNVILTLEVRKDALLVPEESLIPLEKGYFIYVVDNGKARAVPVETGVKFGGLIEVRGDLKSGMLVVTKGNRLIQAGQELEYKTE